jgi:DNA polymerase I
LLLEVEHFDWLVFEPLNDGTGAYNRYFGRLADGSVKIRGIAARRHDTPAYIRAMQGRMLEVMAGAGTIAELRRCEAEVTSIYMAAVEGLPDADPQEMAINRRISRLTYAHRCIEGAALQVYRERGRGVAPGMKIQYVVTDAKRYKVEPAGCAGSFDRVYYRQLIDKAWAEIAFAFKGGTSTVAQTRCRQGVLM